MDSNLTADSILCSTTHDRERRAERQIDKITHQEARRYGMAETQKKGRIKYTYAGHVFIYDPKRNKAISSWKIDGNQANSGHKKKAKVQKSGTRFYKPIMIQVSQDHDTASLRLAHREITAEVHRKKEKWTSHTVLVVDMSGSMRDDDVNGARCRSDGVWTALARDYVKQQLEKGTCSVFDLVSVVTMGTTAKVVVRCEPMTYVLYNKLVSFRDWDVMKPQGHGNYKPAMKQAAELLAINASGTCSLSLMFFSDGKPSDFFQQGIDFQWSAYNEVKTELVEMAGRVGSNFGRRLTFVCVGMAGESENFDTLEQMAKEAEAFGAQASFNRPELNCGSLSQIVTSSVATSLASKLELSSAKTGKSRLIRTGIERERSDAPDDSKVNDSWRVFLASDDSHYVQDVWVWNKKVEDFARIIDPRCNACYKPVVKHSSEDLEPGGQLCKGCRACYFCSRCGLVGGYKKHRLSKACSEFAHERRTGFLVHGSNGSIRYNVAWKKQAFGEGAERLAFKFRFVDSCGKNFIGPVMVAKESRFVEDVENSTKSYLSSHRHAYHKSFMRTQSVARRFADLFNKAPEFTDDHFGVVPRIEFVKPRIFELEDRINAKRYNVLVEPLVPGRYKKFTDNFGAQTGIKRTFAEENFGVDLVTAAKLLGRKYNPVASTIDPVISNENRDKLGALGVIEEGSSEDDDDSSEGSGDDEYSLDRSSRDGTLEAALLRDEDFLVAFSHFTYVRSGGRLMVVDLQGALQTGSDGSKTFLLTDPAIHHRRKRSEKIRQFGRTDLGGKGMRAFFESHKCNGICKLFQFRPKTTPAELDRLFRPPVVDAEELA